jgi:hypothetical protein
MCYDLLKDFAGPVATITAAAVAVFITWRLGRGQLAIAKQQAVTAQQQANTALKRLNLDLYERRFNIYNAALDLYQASLKKGLDDILSAEFIFVRAFRESLFLFERQDGIYDTLDKISEGQSSITANEKNSAEKAKNPKIEINQLVAENAAKARVEFEKLLLTLENQLHKYLDFSKIQ